MTYGKSLVMIRFPTCEVIFLPIQFRDTTKPLREVVIRRGDMMEGLLDRYFRLLAGQLPAAEYGVIAEPADEITPANAGTESPAAICLC